MTKTMKVPPFIPATPAPQATEPMVVMTVRISPRARDKIKWMYRSDLGFNSVSHIIQTAVDEFIAKYS